MESALPRTQGAELRMTKIGSRHALRILGHAHQQPDRRLRFRAGSAPGPARCVSDPGPRGHRAPRARRGRPGAQSEPGDGGRYRAPVSHTAPAMSIPGEHVTSLHDRLEFFLATDALKELSRANWV